MSKLDFNVFVGSDTGFLKGVHLNRESVICKNFRTDVIKPKEQQIASIAWSSPEEQEILIGFRSQKICLFDTEFNCYTWAKSYKLGEGPLVSAFRKSDHIVCGLESGEIGILKGADTTIIKTIFKAESRDKHRKNRTLCTVKPSVLHPSQIASGGCENDLAIWDIQNPEVPVFRAKNVGDDKLSLRVPIWISDITYLPESDQIALTSRHKHVRLYDPRTGAKKPIINFEYGDYPLISIAAVPSAEKQILVGSNHGSMTLFDLRKTKPKNPVRVYKGFIGAVKNISVHETLPLVFSVSLDRHIYVHNLHSKEKIYKEFLKSRLNSILISKNLREEDFLSMTQYGKSKLYDVKVRDAKRLKL